jgi:hypothetical protein
LRPEETGDRCDAGLPGEMRVCRETLSARGPADQGLGGQHAQALLCKQCRPVGEDPQPQLTLQSFDLAGDRPDAFQDLQSDTGACCLL